MSVKIFVFYLLISSFFCQSNYSRISLSENKANALKALCPFPGYHGYFCPDNKNASSRILFQAHPPKVPFPMGVGVSFDITTGDLKLPVLDFSNGSKIWRDFESNVEFMVPNGIDFSYMVGVSLYPSIKIFKNEFNYTDLWVSSINGGTWTGGEFGEAQDILAIYDQFFKGGRSKAVIQDYSFAYQLQTNQRKLNDFAQYAIDSLPKEFTNDYYDFIEAWGTHVSIKTQIGGMREKQIALKDCMWQSPYFTGGLDDKQIQEALIGELNGSPGDAFYLSRRQISLERRIGGDPENLTNWTLTIPLNPAILEVNQHVSWAEFITDPVIKSNMEAAIQNSIDNYKQKRIENYQKVLQARAQELLAPRTIYGTAHFIDENSFTVSSPVTMQNTATCQPGISEPSSVSSCGLLTLMNENAFGHHLCGPLTYERDSSGRFRARYCMVLCENNQLWTGGPGIVFGDWVEKGCSQIFATEHLNDYTKFSSVNGQVCAECNPMTYNDPNGKKQMQCVCPSFQH